MLRILDGSCLNLGLEAAVLTEVFYGFPRCMQSNTEIEP